ncbi:MAG: hypothetical protein HYZ34_08700, partial [Ignavibacteriae bacterium]|nr:hypothetical protein [Ignavibacteriota bacterium]
KKFTHYRIEPTDSTKIGLNMMMSVFEDRTGLLWLGTWDKGVVCFNRERESYQVFPSSLGVKRPSFEDSMGNIYSAENYQIVKYKRGTGIISSKQLSFGTILCLLSDSDGSFWAGTSAGLVHFSLSLDVIEVFMHEAKDTTSIGSGVVGSIAEDANDILWISAGGLNRFDKKTGRFRNFKPDPGNKFRLCLDENIPIYVARDGRIWIGSRGNGLFCFSPATETFVRFTEKDGLPNNYIYGILEDENGSLWISTNRGLCRFEPNAKTWKKYDVSDGLQSNEFNTGAYFKSRNGEFFFGGINGINSFFPHEIEDNTHIPNIVITGFRVFNKPYPLINVITETEEIQLPYDRNFFSFEFAALDYVNTRKNQYRYLLEGYDREWVDAGTTGVADYTDVHPGTYRFRILGSNNDGVWNEEGASIFITITPPYWATWWFRVMMGVLLVGSVSGITRYISVTRMKRTMKELEQQHALEKERLRISKDMHDDLGSRLTQIGLLSELAKRETQNPQHMERTLQEISGTTQDIVQSFDEIVWAVNPRYDTLEGMIDYLAQYAASYVENIGAECRVDLPSVEKSIHVSAEIRHNVFMIVKEALNNTAKYASATEVKFLPTFENQQFSLIIQDNGRGFAPDSVAQFSEGLHNMEKRMEEIGGTFFLTSAPGQGTTIKISVKVS